MSYSRQLMHEEDEIVEHIRREEENMQAGLGLAMEMHDRLFAEMVIYDGFERIATLKSELNLIRINQANEEIWIDDAWIYD